ncbi:head-tail adaptor protein [Polaromonas sp. UBA4122]|nr:head-tail adaptor protein [Polaromonas sp. UBA4122]
MEPLAWREYIAAMSAQSEVTTRIKMRYRPGITSADRIIHTARFTTS